MSSLHHITVMCPGSTSGTGMQSDSRSSCSSGCGYCKFLRTCVRQKKKCLVSHSEQQPLVMRETFLGSDDASAKKFAIPCCFSQSFAAEWPKDDLVQQSATVIPLPRNLCQDAPELLRSEQQSQCCYCPGHFQHLPCRMHQQPHVVIFSKPIASGPILGP